MTPFEELKKENENLRGLLLIKERDLDELEKARKNLFEILPYMNWVDHIKLQNITGIMWLIANSKKYRTGITDDPE